MSIAARYRRCIRIAARRRWAAVTAAGEEPFIKAAADDPSITAADIAAAAAGVEIG
jgi:hypothetical protein